jgi:hypothetical protein
MQKKSARRRAGKWRTTPIGLKHDMDPTFIGIAAAEFMPADPAAWIDAAVAARLEFVRHDGRIIFNPTMRQGDDPHWDFLTGLLAGTPGGMEALAAFMEARGIRGVVADSLVRC